MSGLSFTGLPQAEAATQSVAFVSSPAKTRQRQQAAFSSEQQDQQQDQQHLVLIGGGHAHAQVIKALNEQARPPHLKVTLIDVQEAASYSGMVPACVSGLYTPDQTLLHLPPLAEWSGMNFVNDQVVDVDLDKKLVYLENSPQQPLAFDAVSLDIGSTSRNLDEIPGAREYTIPTRPIAKLVSRLEESLQEATQQQQDATDQPRRLVVIGGGAAGIELSMAVTTRWNAVLQQEQAMSCTLLDAGDELIPQESQESREKLKSILAEKGINVRHKCKVQEVTKDEVLLDDGTQIPYTHCLWATGAGAHTLARRLQNERGLGATDHGWFTVKPTLQSTTHPFVFAAGDCASIEQLPSGPPPKAGVYAVRAGPILIENLTRYLQSLLPKNDDDDKDGDKNKEEDDDVDLMTYEPQRDFLKLLVCGAGKALGFRFGIPIYGKWVFDMKDRIDQNFMQLFHTDNLPDKSTIERGNYDTSQYDASTPVDSKRLDPTDAARLLQRSDDEVDYEDAWATLRAMAQDEEYCQAVLQGIKSKTTELVG